MKNPGWVEWAIIFVLIVVVVIAALVLLGPQMPGPFGGPINNNL